MYYQSFHVTVVTNIYIVLTFCHTWPTIHVACLIHMPDISSPCCMNALLEVYLPLSMHVKMKRMSNEGEPYFIIEIIDMYVYVWV